MTATDERVVITTPGLVPDMDFDVYLADPVQGGSLSHSGAKTLVIKTPAHYAWEREHGRPPKRDFDFGHAAHQMVLGAGPEIVVVQKVTKDKTVVDADNYSTKSAQDHRDEIRAAGNVPVLRAELDAATAMADALRKHPVAAKLLEPGSGQPEVSAFVPDPETGVWMRCRFDWLRRANRGGKLFLVDFKTTTDADEDVFAKSAMNYSYHLQDAWYSTVAKLLGLADDVSFLLIAQEKTPPFLPNVIQLDLTAHRIGQLLMRRALVTYADCARTGTWPGYRPDINVTALPHWYEREFESELS